MISDVNAHYVLILLLNEQMLYCQPIASGRCLQVHRDCTQVHTVEDRIPLFHLCVFPTVSARPFCHPEGNIFCHAGTGTVFCQDAHLFCRGSRCSRENKSDKPILRVSAGSQTKTVSSRIYELEGYRLCFYEEK